MIFFFCFIVSVNVSSRMNREVYLWLGSMVLRPDSGCVEEPVAWLEKRRCVIKLGKKASCSLTTLGMLMESSSKKDEENCITRYRKHHMSATTSLQNARESWIGESASKLENTLNSSEAKHISLLSNIICFLLPSTFPLVENLTNLSRRKKSSEFLLVSLKKC